MITSLIGVVGLGLGVFVFGLAPGSWFWAGAVGCGDPGFHDPIANGPLHAIMQSKIAPEMQGRVMGMTNSICTMMMPLALLISAPVAELLGLEVWYWLGGGLVMLMGAAAFFVPSIMNLDRVVPAPASAVIATAE